MNYQGFKIECFEAGKDLWHARIRCEERTPLEIDGVLFSVFELGFAWPRPEAAIADAQVQIDRLNRRHAARAM